MEAFLEELLREYVEEPPDAIVLGCTHYPFVTHRIREVFGEKGPDVDICDGGAGTARQMKRMIEAAGLLRAEGRQGSVTFSNSDPEGGKIELCQRLLGAE